MTHSCVGFLTQRAQMLLPCRFGSIRMYSRKQEGDTIMRCLSQNPVKCRNAIEIDKKVAMLGGEGLPNSLSKHTAHCDWMNISMTPIITGCIPAMTKMHTAQSKCSDSSHQPPHIVGAQRNTWTNRQGSEWLFSLQTEAHSILLVTYPSQPWLLKACAQSTNCCSDCSHTHIHKGQKCRKKPTAFHYLHNINWLHHVNM